MAAEKTAELIMSMSLDFLQGRITEQTYIFNLEMISKNIKRTV
jgi:hypothetical protein